MKQRTILSLGFVASLFGLLLPIPLYALPLYTQNKAEFFKVNIDIDYAMLLEITSDIPEYYFRNFTNSEFSATVIPSVDYSQYSIENHRQAKPD